MDRKPEPGVVWNRLRPQEQTVILESALQLPDLSPRELACQVTDHARFTVSEATVYRVLKRPGLNRTIPLVGWGWYYSIEVLDDFSRFVLASDGKRDMTADSISDVLEQAVAFTGMR